jgi:MHS family proline/betaine transporter-like MFS transporter
VALPFSFVAAAVVITQVEIFPTRVRYSAAAIGYNVGIMAFGGTAPLAATALVAQTGSAIAPGVYLVVVVMVVFFVTFALPETYRLPLTQGGRRKPDSRPGQKAAPIAAAAGSCSFLFERSI